MARLKQLQKSFERERADAREETHQLQQTLGLLRDEFQKAEEEKQRALEASRKSNDLATRFEGEVKSLRQIMAGMSNELSSMRTRLRDLRDQRHREEDDDTNTTIDEVAKVLPFSERSDDETKVSPTATANTSTTISDDSSSTGQHMKATTKKERQASIFGNALVGLGNLWGSGRQLTSSETTEATTTSDVPTTPTRRVRSRRRSVSDPESSPCRVPTQHSKHALESEVESLRNQLSHLRAEQLDLDINHRCEVNSLKDIVKAISTECENLRSEKKLLIQEKGRLMKAANGG